MKELVVISGKGGTGKTSVTASLAVMAGRSVIADCDVDAADLHLVLKPETVIRRDFFSGREAVIRPAVCTGCGVCREVCRFEAVDKAGDVFRIDRASCEGCGVCVWNCPEKAIDFNERLCGEWVVSKTDCGPMVHARLGTAAENSGKLVATVRREARRIAERENIPLVLVDGPPGIGCPVIATVTGASHVLVVTEPTVAGEHDLERVLALARHFGVPASIAVNKWDLNPGMTERIEEEARRLGALPIGRIRYDPGVTRAQVQGIAVVATDAACAPDLRVLRERIAAETGLFPLK